ncbi:MAG: hypothetical protein LKI93_02045 [Bifidobacteriaceae bacterium]|jgi:hypothetical protein|nr:hypothetical protein [Bifidobacteriaceae bacterium]MCI1914970.1 hypothetical protein [Bifidobacteriaceae bacterium]
MPHQDFVYFNYPTPAESEQVTAFRAQSQSIFDSLMTDERFITAVSHHPGLHNPHESADAFIENPQYLFALLSFLNAHGITPSQEIQEVIGPLDFTDAPAFSLSSMEVLLQGFLFSDAESYAFANDLQTTIRRGLSKTNHIDDTTVTLFTGTELSHQLITSTGKLNGIVSIASAESANMSENLRMVVLTDHIRKEALPLLAERSASFAHIGVVPIFAMLKNEVSGIRPAMLTGSLVAIPNVAQERLENLAHERNVTLSCTPLEGTAAVSVAFTLASHHSLVDIVTQLFEEGLITAIVGTKSLLGEGWDAPCINTLVLASFVGSTVASNQMRGRAIRSTPADPHKTANIWHLVCIEPQSEATFAEQTATFLTSRQRSPLSEDYETLRRRFTHFVGVSYSGNVVESGIERLSIIQPPYDRAGIDTIDTQMLALAARRENLAHEWDHALRRFTEKHRSAVLAETVATTKDNASLAGLNSNVVHVTTSAAFGLFLALFACIAIGTTAFHFLLGVPSSPQLFGFFSTLWPAIVVGIAALVGGVALLNSYLLRNPQRLLVKTGQALLAALRETGIVSQTAAGIETREIHEENGRQSAQSSFEISLANGSLREQNLFADAMAEILSPVKDPRYLIEQRHKTIVATHTTYLPVPQALAKRERDAGALAAELAKVIGPCTTLYTRTPTGKKHLMRAQAKAFATCNGFFVERQRKLTD